MASANHLLRSSEVKPAPLALTSRLIWGPVVPSSAFKVQCSGIHTSAPVFCWTTRITPSDRCASVIRAMSPPRCPVLQRQSVGAPLHRLLGIAHSAVDDKVRDMDAL